MGRGGHRFWVKYMEPWFDLDLKRVESSVRN